MLSNVLWPSEQSQGEQDYDFVYQLNMSELGKMTECVTTVDNMFRFPRHSHVASRGRRPAGY